MSVFNTSAARRHLRAASIVFYVTQSSAMLPVLQNAIAIKWELKWLKEEAGIYSSITLNRNYVNRQVTLLIFMYIVVSLKCVYYIGLSIYLFLRFYSAAKSGTKMREKEAANRSVWWQQKNTSHLYQLRCNCCESVKWWNWELQSELRVNSKTRLINQQQRCPLSHLERVIWYWPNRLMSVQETEVET